MRISGITIPDKKSVAIGLTSIYGIGHAQARAIVTKAHIDPGKKVSELSAAEEQRIRGEFDGREVEGVLKQKVAGNIKRLKDIKSYRGLRHTKHLPSRGQRTKTNSRTVRGNIRKTMGSGKRKVEKK